MRARRAVCITAVLSLVGVAALAGPAVAIGPPAVVDDHDSYQPARAFDITSSSSGTLFGSDAGTGISGHVYLLRAPMTTGSTSIDLGDRAISTVDGSAPTIVGTQVAIPQVAPGVNNPAPVISVRYCAAASCPSTSTFSVPAGSTYLGNGTDVALLVNGAGQLVLAPWGGGATTTIALPGGFTPTTATGDATGVVLNGGGEAVYVARATSTATSLGAANLAVMNGTYVVWYLVGTGPSFDQTRIFAVNRATPSDPPQLVSTLPGAPDFNAFAIGPNQLAYLIGQDDGSNLLYTQGSGAAVLYARHIDSVGLAALEGTSSFVVDDRQAAVPGFYGVPAGASTGTLTGLLPTKQSITSSLALSNSRAAFVDDTSVDNPVFLRSVAGGSPGPESTLSGSSLGGVALSGPYVAFLRSAGVVVGRTDSALSTVAVPAADLARVSLSGHRALVTGGVNSHLVDVVSHAQASLGHTWAALFGDWLYQLDYDTGLLTRKNLVTGALTTVHAAIPGCTTLCVDEESWQLQPWGDAVAYSYDHGGSAPGIVKGLWQGGVTTTLPMLHVTGDGPDWYAFRYWAGQLLVYRTDFTIHLFEGTGAGAADHVLDSYADAPMDLDGEVVGWRPLTDQRAVVRPISAVVAGFTPTPMYLGGTVPAGFGLGSPAGATWAPTMLSSQDVPWTLTVTSGATVVHTQSGSSANGEILPTWDGTVDGGGDAAQGAYTWTLTGLTNPLGGAVTGTVFLSRTAPAAPTLTAPARSTDTSATSSFVVSWSGGSRWRVERSTNGGAFSAWISSTSATSASYAATAGVTYRFRAFALDPAGRISAPSAVRTTVVPYDEGAAGTAYAGTWTRSTNAAMFLGAQRTATAVAATYTFRAVGTTIWLIGARAAHQGRFQVSIDGGAYSAPVDSYLATTRFRQVLYSRTGLSNAAHTIRVRVAGTAGRPAVSIDGVAFLR